MLSVCGRTSSWLGFVPGHSPEALIDLSKATKLREVAFWFGHDATRITNTLRSISPERRGFQKISIFVSQCYGTSLDDPLGPKGIVRKRIYQWMNFDGLLVQLWELHAVRTKLVVGEKAGKGYKLVTGLLPRSMERGIIEPVTYADDILRCYHNQSLQKISRMKFRCAHHTFTE